MKIAVLKERAPGERRVAATPETVKKFIALGAELAVEAGAGETASIADAAYADAGATIGDRVATVAGADLLLGVQGPDPTSVAGAKPGAWLVASLNPVRYGRRARARRCLCRGRARSAGDGVHAADHARAVDGHPVLAVEPVRATRRCSMRPPNMAAPSR